MNIRFLMNRKKIIIIIITASILIPIAAYSAKLIYLLYFRQSPTIVNTINDKQNANNASSNKESGIENIVLFGVDSRTSTDPGRTDSIIIATIDNNSKAIKLSSIMRDLYVPIGTSNSMSKINSAYNRGGPQLALETLNRNFGLNLNYYAVIDFTAFQDLVDQLGGIDVNVKDYEVKEINKYIKEVNWSNPIFISGPGYQHLNGQQALSYSRIRHVGNGDFERTERQRLVLKCLAEKTKQANLLQLPQLLTTIVSYTQTNIPLSRIISLGISAYKFNSNLENMRIPVDNYYKEEIVNGADVLVPDISANAKFLRDFINNSGTGTESKPIPKIPDYQSQNASKDKGTRDKSTLKPTVTPGAKPTITPSPAPDNTKDGQNTGSTTVTPSQTPTDNQSGASPIPTTTPKPVTP